MPTAGFEQVMFQAGSPGFQPNTRTLAETIMDQETVRKFCLSLPHVTEDVQWQNDLLFRIGNKMFAVVALDSSSGHCLSFKCTPEMFAELTEREGIVPAPYVARYHWVALERFNALKDSELKSLLKNSYELVLAKLPKKVKDKFLSDVAIKPGKPKKPSPGKIMTKAGAKRR
jgi:predicted DNA-binding protein (MmcQ/YjbR family)